MNAFSAGVSVRTATVASDVVNNRVGDDYLNDADAAVVFDEGVLRPLDITVGDTVTLMSMVSLSVPMFSDG